MLTTRLVNEPVWVQSGRVMKGCTKFTTLLLILFLVGCGSTVVEGIRPSPEPEIYPSPERKMWTTQIAFLVDTPTEQVSDFGNGQYPAVVIQGYDGERITLQIINTDNGAVVTEVSLRVDSDLFHHSFERLPTGIYEAQLWAHSELEQTYTFTFTQ